MKSLSTARCDRILNLLDSNKSGYQIQSITGVSTSTISRLHAQHCPHLRKASGGCPSKVTDTDIHYVMRLVTSGKVDNAVQVTQALQTITNNTFSPETICLHLKKAGMKAVVKKK
jgi:hypothetical protein